MSIQEMAKNMLNENEICLKKTGMKNVFLRKKNTELSNENKSLYAKLNYLELENKKLHDEMMSFQEKIAFDHENLLRQQMLETYDRQLFLVFYLY